jgi:hypothetical protein
MNMKKTILLISLAIAVACSSGPSPKDTVFEFIDAVKAADSLRIFSILDLDGYIAMTSEGNMAEMSSADTVAALDAYRTRTIESLLRDGDVRHRWLTNQIIVNKEIIKKDTANVEVSFIDQQSGYMLYTQIQLLRQPDKTWRVVFFK